MLMRTLSIVMLALLIAACGKPTPPTASTLPAPTTQTVRATHVPQLQWIQLRHEIQLARTETNINVTPRGFLRQVRITGKSYGPNDIIAKPTTETRVGQLSPEQMAELASLFEGWKDYQTNYKGTADGPEIEIHYGSKKVIGGSGLPPRVQQIRQRLMELGNAMQPLAPHEKASP
jgi:hypothetical protein